jgi:hypothetical protein
MALNRYGQADIRNPLRYLIRVKADIRNPLRYLLDSVKS